MFSIPYSKPTMAIALMLILSAVKAQAIETPEYTVVFSNDQIEYRQYQPYIVAETLVEDSSSYKSASNEGFMRLFRFISGDNSSRSEIAMTAPVQRESVSEEIAMTAPVQRVEQSQGWRISFMLPGNYTMATAPVPDDDRITLRQVESQLMAVVRYSGRWTERNYQKHRDQLLQTVASAGVETLGEVESAAYDAPYVLPFLRRNEVMVEVQSIPSTEQNIASTL